MKFKSALTVGVFFASIGVSLPPGGEAEIDTEKLAPGEREHLRVLCDRGLVVSSEPAEPAEPAPEKPRKGAKKAAEAAEGAVATTGASPAAPPNAVNSVSDMAAGRSSQDNCSSTVYAAALGRMRQLSIDPVGHGGTQAMQKLHLSAITT